MSRSRTAVIAPVAKASHRTNGVAAYVMTAATTKTRRYSRMDQRLAREQCSRISQLFERGYAGKRATRSLTCMRISLDLGWSGSPSVWVTA